MTRDGDVGDSGADQGGLNQDSLLQADFTRGGIVTARGTSDGLVIRLDGRVGQRSLLEALDQFLVSRKSFLEGNQVTLEWVGDMPEDSFVSKISNQLSQDFRISVKDSRLREKIERSTHYDDLDFEGSAAAVHDSSESERRSEVESKGLFGGVDSFDLGDDELGYGTGTQSGSAYQDPMLWDDADTRMVCRTLRSGQKIETEHTLVIMGDVNSGAELIAGGDILVMGTLRGVAHAGAYDETGGGRFIFALNLQPTQLRIGMVISRGGPEPERRAVHDSTGTAEFARVDGNLIVVEPYHAKIISSMRRV